ncbi:MAG: ribonuclease P protein component [Acidimicrobiales bacterium]
MPPWRIRDRRTFDDLRARGRRRRSGPVSVTALAVDDGRPPRVAYAIGKAVGPAVVRNRARRRLRAIAGELELPAGAYLIGISPEGAAVSYAELRDHVAVAAAAASTAAASTAAASTIAASTTAGARSA